VVKKDIVIKNKLGIHARPATMIVKAASKYKSNITFEKDGKGGEVVNAKSIMELLLLEAYNGTKIRITADGVDEEKAMSTIVEIIERGFDEE
jgi:phosphocarrier protein HPr